MVGCDIHSDTFLIKISTNPLVFNVTENVFSVTENMLFSLNKSSTQIALTKCSEGPGNIFGKIFSRKICGDISYRYILNAKRAAVWNYQFLDRGL